MDEIQHETLPAERLRNITEAVRRLSKEKSPIIWHGVQHSQSDTFDPKSVASKIRYVTQSAPPSMGFRQPFPMSQIEKDQMIIYQFEEDLWKLFNLKDPFVPDELLKECQKRLHIAENGPAPSQPVFMGELRKFLDILNTLHHLRKASSSFHNQAPLNINWTSLKAIPPDQFRRNIRSGFGDQFWALIIGNDNYPNNPLRGCLNDASLIRKYLVEYLGVPSHHIRSLTDATRAEIINGLYDLRDQQSITRGDNILIHFSGHGTSYECKDYFTTFTEQAGSIEGICPVDRGNSVPDISDRELNSILHELRIEKGDNITVFLDCCRSGGALRSNDGAVRYTLPLRINEQSSGLQAMLEAADSHPRRRPDTLPTASSSWLSSMGNVDGFVQLAGCHDFQVAKEAVFNLPSLQPSPSSLLPTLVHERLEDLDLSNSGPERGHMNQKSNPNNNAHGNVLGRTIWNGCFTWALINVLKSSIGQLGTYQGVIEIIGGLETMQNPVVIGVRKDSRLWFGKHRNGPGTVYEGPNNTGMALTKHRWTKNPVKYESYVRRLIEILEGLEYGGLHSRFF